MSGSQADHQIELAEAQLVGFVAAMRGTGIEQMIEGMGLTPTEWTTIKRLYPCTISDEMEADIDSYFASYQ